MGIRPAKAVNFVTLVTLTALSPNYLIANFIGVMLVLVARYLTSETIVWTSRKILVK